MTKYLWLVIQEEITAWSTYRSAVVIAKTETEAQGILPTGKMLSGIATWCTPEYVSACYLGVAEPGLESMTGNIICVDAIVDTIVNTRDDKENKQ